MAIPIIDSFERASNKPVDKSMQVNNLEDRDTFPDYKRWEGMSIYVIDEAKEYTLIGGIANENWIQTAPSSGGDASLWSTFPATQSVEMDDYSLLNVNSLVLPNGSSLHVGTTDAGYGGNGGIELECSVGYKLKWDAGRLFTMQQDGFTIREVAHQTIAPTTTDDDTKGYVIGSRWLMDSGDTYIATDATESAAVWIKSTSWNLNGNPDTDPDVDYIGTPDNKDIVIKRNSEEVGRFKNINSEALEFPESSQTGTASGDMIIVTEATKAAQVAHINIYINSEYNSVQSDISGYGIYDNDRRFYIQLSDGYFLELAEYDWNANYINNNFQTGIATYDSIQYSIYKEYIPGRVYFHIPFLGIIINVFNSNDSTEYTFNTTCYSSITNPNINYLKVSDKLVIGTDYPAHSAIADFDSTNKGLLIPRMTTTQRNAITLPVDGLILYDTNIKSSFIRADNTWQKIITDPYSPIWGNIIGTLSDQTDLENRFNTKLDNPSGTTDGTKYLRDDNTWQPVSATGNWSLTGNNITAEDYFGSNNNKDLIFKRNNSLIGTLGISNTAFGLSQGPLGSESTYFGHLVGLNSNTGIDRNTYIGRAAGANANNSAYNVAIGYDAAQLSSNSSYCVSIGEQAGYSSRGSYRVAIGSQAAWGTGGNSANMISIGASSSNSSANSPNSTIVGTSANFGSPGNDNIVAIGYSALNNSGGSGSSVAVGSRALINAGNGFGSVAVGFSSGEGNSSKQYNITIGYKAGTVFTSNTIGSNNIIIGASCTLPNATANSITIGNVLYGTGILSGNNTGDSSITPTATGRIGIGIVTPTAVLDLRANTTAEAAIRLRVGAAPTSPNDGDIWLESNTNTGLKIRINGVTKTISLI